MPIFVTGIKRLKTITPNTMVAMAIAVDRISAIIEAVAVAHYLQAKAKKGTSEKIVSSFKYETEFGGIGEVRGYVTAGGDDAPYAKFVDEGHKYIRHSGSFSGHHFIKVGADAGRKVAAKIVLEEIRKQTRRFGGGISTAINIPSETGIKG